MQQDTTTDISQPDPAAAVSRRRESLAKCRQGRRRIDYYPEQFAVAIIDKVRPMYPDLTVSNIISDLIEAGYPVLFPAKKESKHKS